MLLVDAAKTAAALPYAALVDAIDAAFKGGCTVPVRAHPCRAPRATMRCGDVLWLCAVVRRCGE